MSGPWESWEPDTRGGTRCAPRSRVRSFEEIRVYDSFPKALESYVVELSEDLGRPVEPVRRPQDLVVNSDVIITCTNTTVPIVQKEWLRPGMHFSCMGADQAWKQELANGVHARCTIFGDHMEQICHLGEVSEPLEKGHIDREHIRGTLGQVINGTVEGRTVRRGDHPLRRHRHGHPGRGRGPAHLRSGGSGRVRDLGRTLIFPLLRRRLLPLAGLDLDGFGAVDEKPGQRADQVHGGDEEKEGIVVGCVDPGAVPPTAGRCCSPGSDRRWEERGRHRRYPTC